MPEQFEHIVTALFKRMANGSEAALPEIGGLYKTRLISYINRIVQNMELSKEVFADVMKALWDNRKELGVMKNPAGWMFTTAHHKAVNKVRDEKRIHTIPLQGLADLTSTLNIEEELESKELHIKIQLAEEKLSPREKLVYTLKIKHGLSRKDIAKQLGVSENTIKNQLTSAVRNIRNQLGKM